MVVQRYCRDLPWDIQRSLGQLRGEGKMTMNLTPIINPRRFVLARWAGAMGAFVFGLGLLIGAGTAAAQLRPWNAGNDVFVDLTVLEGGQVRRPARSFAAPGANTFSAPGSLGLLEPPRRQPASQLLVRRPPRVGARSTDRLLPAVKLRRPGSAAKKTRQPRRRAQAQPIRKPPARPKVVARAAEPAQKKPAKPARSLKPLAPKPAPEAAKSAPTPKQVAKAAPPKIPDIAPPPPPVAAPKPAVQAPSAPPKPQRQASLPGPAPKAAALGSSSIAFAVGEADLDAAGKARLDGLAKRLKVQSKIRMQLLAYAGGENLSASKARRLSLSRALAIRSYLIGKGVRSTRIDVRALGNKVPSGKPGRVDLKIIQR
jgi:outer membrane protein OmpA-like peptidoglycan-associated protein